MTGVAARAAGAVVSGWLNRTAAAQPYIRTNTERLAPTPPDLHDCTDDAPDVHVFPDGWMTGHLHPRGTVAIDDALGLTVTVDPDTRAAASTWSCPCWPAVAAVRDGTSVGRRITHQPLPREVTP